MQTMWDLIQALEEQPELLLRPYDRRGRPEAPRSYREVARRSRAIGRAFLEEGIEPGTILFLQLPNGLELVECFLGAVAGGLVPCCLAPPRALGGLEVFRERLRLLLDAFPGARLVTRPEIGAETDVPFLTPPQVAADAPLAPPRRVDPEELAFVQLTSGSTRLPRAVCIPHRALVANARGIIASGCGRPEDVFVSWLPLYHDMGLVGLLLTPLVMGSELHLMRPETFLARPRTWLEVITEVEGAAITTAPNFAYQHCVDKIRPRVLERLDLSRWRIAGCGAERVRPETLAAFADKFAPAGFRPEAFVPCYGMAETTLAVTLSAGGRVPPVDDGNVSCGAPVPDTEIVIRNAAGQPLPEGEAGEITVRGPGLFAGYRGARTQSPLNDGWLHTGDRGYLKDGELYVTGRFKDLLIIDGVNIDPDEIEAVGEAAVNTVAGRAGAFSVEVGGRERPVLVVEVARAEDPETLAARAEQIGDGVASLFGFALHDLVFVRRGTLPTTSSGKVKRAELKKRYLADEFPALSRHPSPKGRR